jgi:hypothetical protein
MLLFGSPVVLHVLVRYITVTTTTLPVVLLVLLLVMQILVPLSGYSSC